MNTPWRDRARGRAAPLVVVSDLDGTLLDAATYSAAPALPVIERLRQAGIPLVFCSSKTRAEIEALMARVGIDQPFICENGGGVYFPKAAFPDVDAAGTVAGNRIRIELGRPYAEVIAIMRETTEHQQVRIRGFADMTIAEIAEDCGLSPLESQLAKLREFDEPFRLLERDTGVCARYLRALHRRGLRTVQGGRYWHATGDTDKGLAVEMVRSILGRYEPVVMVGLGDGPNDVPLLQAVDLPVIVRNDAHDGTARMARKVPGALITDEPGPAGWAAAVTAALASWESGQLHPRSRGVRR